jgi:Ca-activated chloride channel homolog
MLSFEHKEYLLMLLIIPVLLGLYLLSKYLWKKNISEFGNPELVKSLMPEHSEFRRNLKFLILLLSVLLLTIALAGPRVGSKLTEVKREGIEIIVALDISNSMLAEDIKPNRLERAKQELSRLVDRLENDRIGLIVFAGDAYTQIPITNDFLSAKMFLSGINTNMVTRQGTAIGAAIELSIKSFDMQSQTGKAIIIISDGENHEEGVMGACKAASEKGIKIFTVGMGTPTGVRIPVNSDPYNKDYHRDSDGNFVITRLNEQMLMEVAAAAGGKYYRANAPNLGLNNVLAELNKLNKTEIDYKVYTDYEEQFPVFVWGAFLLLCLDLLILDRKNKWLKGFRLLEKK